MERATFSPFWHRIRALKPRLRPHVQITRQHYRGRRWHIAHDPTNNQFYRLSPIAYDLISMLDGQRTVEEAWKTSLGKFGDMAPTQNEVLELLAQLYGSNLLSVDSSPETEQLLGRGRERAKKRALGQAVGLMYFKLRVLNPTAILNFCLPIVKPVLNRWGLIAWAIFLIYCLATVLPQWSRLVGGFDTITSPANWGWMLLAYILLKGWHEFGHGIICTRFGGQVPEFGFMLLVFIPSPFVDASSCWAFPNKWQRVAVGAGGMIFELFAAGVASLVWLAAPDGSFAKQLSYFIMVSASVSTVIFNANPLMRFDGYYILSDVIEVPNLMTRSTQMLKYLCQRYLYLVKSARIPSTQPGEIAILIIYGVLSLLYRIFLFVVITLYVLGQFFGIGVFLAVWTAAMWFILPMGKFVHWVSSSSQLHDHRGRAILTSLALVAGTALLVGLVPLPDYRRAAGVVESPLTSGVFQGTEGFVAAAHVRPGDTVKKGDPVVTLSSPELSAAKSAVLGKIGETKVDHSEAVARDDNGRAVAALRNLQSLDEQLRDIENREEKLIVRAPHDGVIVAADPQLVVGSYGPAGRPICVVVDQSQCRVVATVTQSDASWLFQMPREDYQVQMRLVSRPYDIIEGGGVRAVPAGQKQLPHGALGFGGGGQVEVNPNDPTHRAMKNEQFQVYVDLDEATRQHLPLGQRVYVRFTLPSKPLIVQAWDRLEKALQGKISL